MSETNLRNIEIQEDEILFNNFNDEFIDKGQVTFGLFANGVTMVKGDDVQGKPHKILSVYENNKIKDVSLITKIKEMKLPNIIKFVKTGPVYFQCK